MNIREAIQILVGYGSQDNVTIIVAINSLVADELFMSSDERQEVFDLCWLIGWDKRFINQLPHDGSNPGVVADAHRPDFIFKGISFAVAQAVLML